MESTFLSLLLRTVLAACRRALDSGAVPKNFPDRRKKEDPETSSLVLPLVGPGNSPPQLDRKTSE
jgi:hypothetical protein